MGTKTKVMPRSFTIDPYLWADAREIAIANGVSMNEAVRIFCRELVAGDYLLPAEREKRAALAEFAKDL